MGHATEMERQNLQYAISSGNDEWDSPVLGHEWELKRKEKEPRLPYVYTRKLSPNPYQKLSIHFYRIDDFSCFYRFISYMFQSDRTVKENNWNIEMNKKEMQ